MGEAQGTRYRREAESGREGKLKEERGWGVEIVRVEEERQQRVVTVEWREAAARDRTCKARCATQANTPVKLARALMRLAARLALALTQLAGPVHVWVWVSEGKSQKN